MTSNSSAQLQPSLQPLQQAHQCFFQEELPHDFTLIHSKYRESKILPCRSLSRNHVSTPSLQQSANIGSEPRQLMLKTSQPSRNESLSAKFYFYQNSEQQKSKKGLEKWKRINQTMKADRHNSAVKVKKILGTFDDEEEQISENWLQDLSATVGLYTMICKQSHSSNKRDKVSWFKQFVEKGKREAIKTVDSTGIEQTEDSFEIIDKEEPGPAHYNQPSPSKLKNAKNTFGSTKRFQQNRAISSASIGIPPQSSTFQKKANRNQMKNVCFGTNISNPRSQIKKVQYCQWYRSHCCQSTPNLASLSLKKYHNTANHFVSSVQRFPEPPQKYNGPDYNCKVKVKPKKQTMPAHYFLSDVKKGLPDIQKQNYLPEILCEKNQLGFKNIANSTYKQCIKKQNLRKQQIFPKYNQNFGQTELCKQIQAQIPKNSLGDRNRSISPKKKNLKKKILQEENQCNSESEISPTRELKQPNQWIKKSFNVKFQVWE